MGPCVGGLGLSVADGTRPAADGVEVRLATPDDAGPIAGLVAREYGADYADLHLQDPAWVARALAEGDLLFAVATRGGAHAGQMALERRGAALWENGRAVVDPDLRGRGLLARMGDLLFEALAGRSEARFVLGRSVTRHVVTQRYCLARGFAPLGLLLELFPGGEAGLLSGRAVAPQGAGGGRVADAGPALSPARLAGAAGVALRPAAPAGAPPLGAVVDHGPRGAVHVRVAAGAPAALDEAWAALAVAGACRAWLDLPIERADAATLVDAARARGFAFGALLPWAGPAGEHLLRLQRPAAPPDAARLRAVAAWQPLVAAVLADLQAAGAPAAGGP